MAERSRAEWGLGAGSRRATETPGCAQTLFKVSTPGQRCWQPRFRGDKDGQGTNMGFRPRWEGGSDLAHLHALTQSL